MLKVTASGTRTAVVNTGHQVAFCRQVLVPKVSCTAPSIEDVLRTRTPIDVHQDGIFFVGVKVCWLDQVAIEYGAVNGWEGEKFFFAKGKGSHTAFQGSIVFQYFQCLAAGLIERDRHWAVGTAMVANEEAVIRAHVDTVRTLSWAKQLFAFAIELDHVQVSLQR